jgi:multisubunit Na+/H+ antiporter MnhB subunit
MMSKRNLAAFVFFVIVAVFLFFGALLTHPFGVPDNAKMDDEIIDDSQVETGANNAVTSVVFDYRGFDTLGEATILFTAVAGVILVFRRLKK